MNPRQRLNPDDYERLTIGAGEILTAVTTREGEDTDRSFTARLLTYGEETRDWRNLSFAPGSLHWDEPVPLAYAHQTGDGLFGSKPIIVGKSEKFWDDDGAAYAEFSLAQTTDADEVWNLITHGALSAVSVGGAISRYERNEDEDSVLVLDFDGYEISVVPTPAMKSARIQNQPDRQLVTLAPKEEDMDPNATDASTEPANLEARLAALEDQTREILASGEKIPDITGTARGGNYHSLGEIIADAALMDRADDTAARDRLGALLEAGKVSRGPDGTRLIDVFAFTEIGDSTDALSGGQYVDSLLELLRDAQVTSLMFQRGDLGMIPGPVVPTRKVTQGGLVDYSAEGGAVPMQKQTWGDEQFPKVTLSGGQGVTVQGRDWSSPAYMEEVVSDLVSAYGEKLNFETVNGDGVAGPPVHMTGILTANPNYIDAGGTSEEAQQKNFIKAIGASKAAVYKGSKRWPGVMIANGDLFGFLDGWTDTVGRPLLATDGAFNAIGSENGPVPVGTLRGLTCYADDAVPANMAITGSFRDAKLWIAQQAPAQVGIMYPDVLTIDVAIYGYSALAIRRPGAFQAIENIGVDTTPLKGKK